jgi:hypothetical protein
MPARSSSTAGTAATAALHVAVLNTDALYAFVIDRLTERPEVGDVQTSIVYEHLRNFVIEPLSNSRR